MSNDFKVVPIDNLRFNHLFKLDEKELSELCAKRIIVDATPGYPCRISLEEAKIGEEVILFTFEHHKVNSPYKASGPVFIRSNVKSANLGTNEIPEILKYRQLSLRAYDSNGMMIEARTAKGKNLTEEIKNIFSINLVKYIHVHNSNPGCYNCQINRVN